MADNVGFDQVTAMLLAIVKKIDENHEHLSKLDSATGDGDHGTAMLRSVEVIRSTIEGFEGTDIAALMKKIGWDIMSAAGGSTSSLLGSLFMGFKDGIEADADSLDAAGLAAMFEGGLAKIRRATKAQIGDKTLIDALVPAIDAMRAAADAGKSPAEAMADAADAAEKGAAATSDMLAKFGRARNLGERVIGHIDPGATSMSYMFRAMSDTLAG